MLDTTSNEYYSTMYLILLATAARLNSEAVWGLGQTDGGRGEGGRREEGGEGRGHDGQ